MRLWLLLLLTTQFFGCLQDIDRDGFSSPEDCHDGDPTVFPGSPEICDSKDNNCDGAIDKDPHPDHQFTIKYCEDLDGDTFGDPSSCEFRCYPPTNFVNYAANDLDCDDTRGAVHPGLEEVCRDGLVNGCDEAQAAELCGWPRQVDLVAPGTEVVRWVGGESYVRVGQAVESWGEFLFFTAFDRTRASDPRYGSLFMVSHHDLFELNGDNAVGHLTPAAAVGGDALLIAQLDDDRRPEVFLGAMNDHSGHGGVYLFSNLEPGAQQIPARPDSLIMGSRYGDRIGSDLALLSLENKSYLAIGAPEAWDGYEFDSVRGGAVYFFDADPATWMGNRSAVSESIGWAECHVLDIYFGAQLAQADMDGDGRDEWFATANDFPEPGLSGGLFGWVDIPQGRINCRSADYTAWAGQSYSGKSVTPLGDLNGDGRPELALGVEGGDLEHGGVQILSATGSDSQLHRVGQVIGSSQVTIGQDVDVAGDLDFDGRNDLLVAGCNNEQARAYLFIDAVPGTYAPEDARTAFAQPTDRSCEGVNVRGIRSLDGDRYDEVVIAMPLWRRSAVGEPDGNAEIGLTAVIPGLGF